uniref:3-oxoacyl-[acyl-carrier-protein] reductase n=1 Tax=Nymphaea colorata TaxID=210225 RepID=A0A5K1EPW4_9MAGN
MNTDLRGTWLVSKCMCKLMIGEKQKSSIINIGSVAGIDRGQYPGSMAYSIAKTGVNMMTKVTYVLI